MSETTDKETRRRAARAAKSTSGTRTARSFTMAAQGENVVLADATSGRSWALGSDNGKPVWQPIGFMGPADKAPKHQKDDEE